MKMTMLQFINNCAALLLESEEYLLNANRVQGFKGTGFNQDGEVIVSDEEGNEILLYDLINRDTVEDLCLAYPSLPKEVVQKIRDKFFSVYKFYDPVEFYDKMQNRVEEGVREASYWNQVVDWF